MYVNFNYWMGKPSLCLASCNDRDEFLHRRGRPALHLIQEDSTLLHTDLTNDTLLLKPMIDTNCIGRIGLREENIAISVLHQPNIIYGADLP